MKGKGQNVAKVVSMSIYLVEYFRREGYLTK